MKSIDELKQEQYDLKAKLHEVIEFLFNVHDGETDFINSVIHEAEHVKQAMLYAYRVEDRGEPPAYTIGYLVSQMYHVFRNFL